jgi:hypothetical protein
VSVAKYSDVSKVHGAPLAGMPVFNGDALAGQPSAFPRHERGQFLLGGPAGCLFAPLKNQ